jgi:hypothetical protein
MDCTALQVLCRGVVWGVFFFCCCCCCCQARRRQSRLLQSSMESVVLLRILIGTLLCKLCWLVVAPGLQQCPPRVQSHKAAGFFQCCCCGCRASGRFWEGS